MLRDLLHVINRSLGLRLLIFAGALIALALALAWLALGLLFERHSERQLQAELERQGIALIAALELDASGRPALRRPLVDPRFDRPASGLYWRASSPAGELRSRSLWDGVIPPPPRNAKVGWTAFNAKGPYEGEVLIIARNVRLAPGDPDLLVEVATDRRPVTSARTAFATEAGLFLGILWLVLAIAAWVQVRLGLQPLRSITGELAAMSNRIETRLSDADHPVEVRPLTEAINAFADRRAADVVQARERARDLAHALKTPITALRMQIELLDTAPRNDMSHSLALLTGAVESELARDGQSASGRTANAAQMVDRLFAVVSRTPDGARLDLRNLLPADLEIGLSEEAALEAFGALIENAARHASHTVTVDGGGSEDGSRWVTICDDGAGIPEALRPAALGRGVRLDERGTRHGLGLSIAQSFIVASGGTIALETAAIGGLCVRLDWRRE